jgi:2OG-Fe(II) oxygenase superfamily
MFENKIIQLKSDELELLDGINTKYIKTGLAYGWPSNTDKKYDQGHWNKEILVNSTVYPFDMSMLPQIDRHTEVKKLWEIIKERAGLDRALLRVYVNGYTYGTDGYAHIDDVWIKKKFGEDALSETTVVYLNENWHVDWGGETVMFDAEGDVTASVVPRYGRIFSFDSNILHTARPVSRACTVLRKVIVFKTVDKKAVNDKVTILFNAYRDHRDAFEHTFNTMVNIERLKASDEVIIAGLYHQVYKHFNVTREYVSSIIGEYAESLAWITSSLDYNKLDQYDDKIKHDIITIELSSIKAIGEDKKYEREISMLSAELKKLK